MNTRIFFVGSWLLCASAGWAGTEAESLEILNSQQSSLSQKHDALATLKTNATAASVEALKHLLGDRELSHSARNVLETLEGKAAAAALREGLKTARGPTRQGILHSLALRKDAESVPVINDVLKTGDDADAQAAARALGQIGSEAALRYLLEALPAATASRLEALHSAILQAAGQLRETGTIQIANGAFKTVYDQAKQWHLRLAAFEGYLLSLPEAPTPQIAAALRKGEEPARTAALQAAAQIKDPTVTRVLAEQLGEATPELRLAIVRALQQRGDVTARAALSTEAARPDSIARVAAIEALGTLGGTESIPALLEGALAKDAPIQSAAREALQGLGPEAAPKLSSRVRTGSPVEQAELLRVIALRPEGKTSAGLFLQYAGAADPEVGKAALRALGTLGTVNEIPPLVGVLRSATSTGGIEEARLALSAVCRRNANKPGFDVAPVLAGLQDARPEVRAALFGVCAELSEPKVREALRNGARSQNAALREPAIRAICDSTDAELMPDMLQLAIVAEPPALRVLAIQGFIRMAADEESLRATPAQRAEWLGTALKTANRVEEKRLVLARLAGVPALQALKLAQDLLEDPALSAEAAQSAVQVASLIAVQHEPEARAVLEKVAQGSKDARLKDSTLKALQKLDANAGFITQWQVSPVYRKEGATFSALFEIPFPPESGGGEWKPLPPGTPPEPPWSMDLLKAFGGEQCVAYARTRVFSPKTQECILEMGTDDGVKAWLNGKVVHSNNTARPLAAGQDKAKATLNGGWNLLLLKVTQNNLGWGFIVRCVTPQGTRLEGVRFDTTF